MPTLDDPEALREARRQAAKDRVAAMTPEEITARIEGSKPGKPSSMRLSSLPTSSADPVRELSGAHDLVFPVHFFDDHTTGDGSDWVNATGQGFPHSLRAAGWVYLKADGRVGARCRALRIEYRENLHEHTPDHGIHAPIAQAAVIALDASTWESVDFPAHPNHQQGYRYASTNDETYQVTHLINGDPDGTFPLRP